LERELEQKLERELEQELELERKQSTNMTPKSSDSAIVKALQILARDIDSEDGLPNMALYEAANRMEQLVAANHKLREACAAVLSADDKGCPTLREARALCVEALKEVQG